MAVLSDFPSSIDAGDSLTVALQAPDYPAGTWTLTLEGIAGTASISATATGSGTTHTFTILPATSAAWLPRQYSYRVYATQAGVARERVSDGLLTVLPNFAATQPESHARKTLRLIQAQIEGRAEDGIETFSLDGQSITSMSAEQLLRWRGIYQNAVAQEAQAITGKGSVRQHRVRFTNPQ